MRHGKKMTALKIENMNNAAKLFQLEFPFDFGLTKSSEAIKTNNNRHTFFISDTSEYSLYEIIAKAKINEMTNFDLFNIEVDGSELGCAAFNNLTTTLLLCWTYNIMGIYLDDDDMNNELAYLSRAYKKFCQQLPSDGVSIVAAASYAVLCSFGRISSQQSLCKNHIDAQNLAQITTTFSYRNPGLPELCEFFNALNPPILAMPTDQGVKLFPR